MATHDPNKSKGRVPANIADPKAAEPSMSAPQPMPGKPAASYVKQQTAAPARPADWQPPQNSSGWSGAYPVQQYPAYPPQQSYPVRTPSQGIPGGQLPPQQYSGWQQAQMPPQQQSYQTPPGRGWSQPYANQQNQNEWQGGYTVNQWSGGGYAPAYENMLGQEQPPKPPRGPMSRSTILKLIAAAAAVVIAIVVVVGLMVRRNQINALYASVAAYNDRYCQGVYVDGIHLGGITREEAYNTVQQSAQLKCDEWRVQLITPDGALLDEIDSKDLGLTVHVEDALNDAWQQGHTGATVEERRAAMEALLETPYHVSTALPSGNNQVIETILSDLAAKEYVPAENATFQFEPDYTYPFTIEPEVVGKYLDVASVKQQVYDMVARMESGTIMLETTPIYPTVTAAQVHQKTALIATAYTAISSTSSPNRDANIERACELINGTKIEPGKTFSFNGVVGSRSKKNGFHLATVYEYGKEAEGYGGGVCQVSSTMYWAAIRANLEIVKREQHSLKVGYTALGYDATVNYDGRKIDFSFRNNTGSTLYITTKVRWIPSIDSKHYLVVCEIYGPAPEANVTYDIVAVESDIPIPEEIPVVPDEKAEYVTYTDETKTVPGKVGTLVESYKVMYVDGVEVERTPLYTDTYKPVQTVTYVGVTERPLPTTTPWN